MRVGGADADGGGFDLTRGKSFLSSSLLLLLLDESLLLLLDEICLLRFPCGCLLMDPCVGVSILAADALVVDVVFVTVDGDGDCVRVFSFFDLCDSVDLDFTSGRFLAATTFGAANDDGVDEETDAADEVDCVTLLEVLVGVGVVVVLTAAVLLSIDAAVGVGGGGLVVGGGGTGAVGVVEMTLDGGEAEAGDGVGSVLTVGGWSWMVAFVSSIGESMTMGVAICVGGWTGGVATGGD